jgi:hypothetical protein
MNSLDSATDISFQVLSKKELMTVKSTTRKQYLLPFVLLLQDKAVRL